MRLTSGWARRAGLHADAGLIACVLTLIQLNDAYAGRACAETHAPTRGIQAQGIRT